MIFTILFYTFSAAHDAQLQSTHSEEWYKLVAQRHTDKGGQGKLLMHRESKSIAVT